MNFLEFVCVSKCNHRKGEMDYSTSVLVFLSSVCGANVPLRDGVVDICAGYVKKGRWRILATDTIPKYIDCFNCLSSLLLLSSLLSSISPDTSIASKVLHALFWSWLWFSPTSVVRTHSAMCCAQGNERSNTAPGPAISVVVRQTAPGTV